MLHTKAGLAAFSVNCSKMQGRKNAGLVVFSVNSEQDANAHERTWMDRGVGAMENDAIRG